MASFSATVRRAARRLLRVPSFSVIAVLTLAVGIGANTAIFSVVYGVLLKPLPFAEPDRLVGVWHSAPAMGFPLLNMGPAFYLTYREHGQVFEDIGVWDNRAVSVTGIGDPERVEALEVTDGTLPVLRVQPLLGRLITRQDDSPGQPRRVVLTYAYWQRKFGGDPAAVGRSLTVEGQPCEVIGVLPAGFRFLDMDPALLMPIQFDRSKIFVGHFSYQAVARLRPGATIAQANADIERLIPRVIDGFPLPPGFTLDMLSQIKLSANVRPLSADAIGDVGQVLWILLGTVGLVLLIACANVANLFLVRAEGRQQELAVRTALGASRGRIARLLLGESVALGLLGGAIGVLLAWAGVRLLVRIAPAGLPRLGEIGINGVVLLFTLAVSILAGLLFGLVPVIRFGRPSVTALKEGGRSSSDAPGRRRARGVLVVSEIALALVLLVVSGLMVRTFIALRQVEPGFVRPEEVQTFRIAIPDALVPDPAQAVRLHEAIARRVAQVPGVTAVASSSSVTMDGWDSNDPVFVEEFPEPGGRMAPIRRFKWISPGYHEALGNRVIAGRTFTWTDLYATAPVAIVSENFVRQYWRQPAEALGKRIRQTPQSAWREIVGVVGDERDDGAARPAPVIVFWPMLMKDFWQPGITAQRNQRYVVRSARTNSPTFLEELQRAVWSVNPDLPLASVQTLDEIRAESMAQTSFALVMLAIAAGVALLLGIVGIYGVVAYTAAQRTREVGVRMALGAAPRDVRRLFLGHGLLLTGIGLALGVLASVILTRVMGSLLFGVNPIDPATYATMAAALGFIALLASDLPARRAARVDPVQALRSDV